MAAIEMGQVVYITEKELFNEELVNLTPGVVELVNSNSFYVRMEHRHKLMRFNKRCMTHEGSFFVATAYLHASEYWQGVANEREKRNLTRKLLKDIERMSLLDLRKLYIAVTGSEEPITSTHWQLIVRGYSEEVAIELTLEQAKEELRLLVSREEKNVN